MESLISKTTLLDLEKMIDVGSSDDQAELEIKVLAGQIQTKDVVDRITEVIREMTNTGATEEHRATFSYSDGLRASVTGAENIHKLCTTNTFRGLTVNLERKTRYNESGMGGAVSIPDLIDIPDLKIRATLRKEQPVRKDFSGAPLDPAAYIRILHRKSWKTPDGILRIDLSSVKSRQKSHKSFVDILKQTPSYELEVEVINKEAKTKQILNSLLSTVEPLLASYQKSPFLLSQSDLQRYEIEFNSMRIKFLNPITLAKEHLLADRPHNILSGYTVTNKADGERCMLVVMRDKKMLRVDAKGRISWTGFTALKDSHIGDIIDGEYLYDRNLFCIFDVYALKGKRTTSLPLFTTDEDIIKNPSKSRLGCALTFVNDLKTDFGVMSAKTPMRIETKLFLAGDSHSMETAIQRMLETKFEYPTDGLIFTPRASPVGPIADLKGKVWLRVYKWKPASQNSIDFLVRIKKEQTYDPVTRQNAVSGTLYVSRNPGTDIVYPCETITGEYTPPEFPEDMRRQMEDQDIVPSPFQPIAPRDPSAMNIIIPVNNRGIPMDSEGNRIEDNTIIECVRDVPNSRWNVLRTRYDKTYELRVLNERQYGNYIDVADNIWTNIHDPITEEMIKHVASVPIDDTFEDDLYYRDALEARDRVLKDVYAFHNRVKEQLYHSSVKTGDKLLELAVGRAGDLHKWRKAKPSLVVGVELSKSNLISPRQGACARYLRERKKSNLPPVLFIEGDMTQPLYEQQSDYFKLLAGTQNAPTEYLQKFYNIENYDAISCQFAIHYACESEDQFQIFADNLEKYGKGMFFGACMDGKEVYSLLMGKPSHTFRATSQIFGEFTKQYDDGEGWTEDFGKAIDVKLESFERKVREYLVPFDRIVQILGEKGYELVSTMLFRDHYAQQTEFVFTEEQQAFSFLHRSFVFKKREAKAKPVVKKTIKIQKPVEEKKEKEEEQKVDVPVLEEKKEEKKEEKPLVEEQKKDEKTTPVFFFSGNPLLSEYKEFSNMYEAPFQVDSVTFPTVEHYFQYMKAKTFGDADAEKAIMKTKSAKSAKTYGKKVKDFKEEEWTSKKEEIMKTGIRAKFAQHPELRSKLMETGNRIIGEADPRDKYWGIGTSAGTSKANKPDQWPGKNILGKILMEIRDGFKSEA